MNELVIISGLSLAAVTLAAASCPITFMSVLVKLYPKDDPRQNELVAELYGLNRFKQCGFILGQIATVSTDAIPTRVRNRRSRDSEGDVEKNHARPQIPAHLQPAIKIKWGQVVLTKERRTPNVVILNNSDHLKIGSYGGADIIYPSGKIKTYYLLKEQLTRPVYMHDETAAEGD